jgi:hypothetical protein
MWWAALLNSFTAILDSGGAGAGGGAFESIATATGTGSSGTITFSSIPSTYQHLQLRYISNDASGGNVYLRFNADSGTNYAYHRLLGNGSVTSASGAVTSSQIFWTGYAPATASTMGASIIDIHNYKNTTQNKTARIFTGYDLNGSGVVYSNSGLWLNTNAITSITLIADSGGNFTTSSVFSLYGIKG